MTAADEYASVRYLVTDVQAEIARLQGTGQAFRSDVVTGPGGRQVLLADPDGNLVELFEAARRPAAAAPATP